MSSQSELIVVIAVGCEGAHADGITDGTNCACTAFGKLHASFIAAGRVESP